MREGPRRRRGAERCWVRTMAEDELDAEPEVDDEETEDEEDGARPPGSKKKLLLIIGLALLVVVGGSAGAYFSGLLDPVIALLMGDPKKNEEVAALKGAVFYDLPELLVNLNTGSRKPTFLKIRISLELEDEKDIQAVQTMMPRIIDNFQVYLRELRVEDLKGSAGMYRLREELLTRVSTASAPSKVNDVLFREMLVQ